MNVHFLSFVLEINQEILLKLMFHFHTLKCSSLMGQQRFEIPEQKYLDYIQNLKLASANNISKNRLL